MTKKRDTKREETLASKRARRPSGPVSSDIVHAHGLAGINEQLLVEQEKLRGRILELHESNDQASRTARTMERLARLVEENPDPALRVYPDGRIRYKNPASFELCRRWYPGDTQRIPPAVQEIVSAAYARTETIRREMAFGEYTCLITVAPALPPANYVNIFASDITARKRAEEALRELNVTLESKVAQRTAELRHRATQLQRLALEMSEAEDRERGRIAQILHDDLQQELAAARFHLSLVRDRAKYDSSLRQITAEVEGMLKNAIDKSRGLSHELSPAIMHEDDFAEILRGLASEMQARHGLTVRVQGRAHCQSDPLKAFLYRAVQELLFNAVKHAYVNEATIQVRQRGGYIGLSVSDRGRGFDPGKLHETAGLGLLSIRERIELLGGRMKIKSAPGRGSTFLVVVPDGETAGEWDGRTKRGERSTAEQRERLRVLVADDHEIVRQGLVSLLGEEHSIKIVGEAANGREVVRLAEQLRPDVVVMDVAMPLMNGCEATRQIKASLPQIRVVGLSMCNEPEAVENVERAGAESYVLKTAPFDELLAAIRGENRTPTDVPCGSTV